MDVVKRIQKLQKVHGWTDYETAKRAGLSHTTISNMYKRNTIPNIFTLESICSAFGITLSQFFYDSSKDKDSLQITPELQYLFDNWIELSNENKELILQLIKALR